MVDAVANVLLETLRDLLVEEVKFLSDVKFLSGVSDEVTKVEADLRTIHGWLMVADSNRGRSPSPILKICIDELKELAFKAEIWETHHWDILKPAFPTKNCKVVLTTRNQSIASQECHLYKLDFLSEDEGWELLAKIALPKIVLNNRSKSLEDVGRKMVQKCGRLPLAISVIGGVLHQKKQILAEWEKVSSNMDSFLRHGGEGIGNDTRVKLVLDLSFDVLPCYLKPCFLYLSCFPEDEEIHPERLYLLWLAEGLISLEEKGDNETLRDVAQRYLTEFASRCMVQLEKGDYSTPTL